MLYALVFVAGLTMASCQRPTYAGSSPIGYPGLASRFKDDSTSTTVDVNNRLGNGGTTQRLPVDARGDADLVNRLNQWPRENRPFWFINAEHIEAQRGGNNRPTRNNLETRGGFFEPIAQGPIQQVVDPSILGVIP